MAHISPDLQTPGVPIAPDATSHVTLEPGEYILRTNVAWEIVSKGGKQYLVGTSVAGVRALSASNLGNVAGTAQGVGCECALEKGERGSAA